MGIRFVCDSCDRKLHVKAFLAGKLGLCPHCNARVRIPSEEQAQSQTPAPKTPAPKTPAPKTPAPKTLVQSGAPSGAAGQQADIESDLREPTGATGPPSLPLPSVPSDAAAADPISEQPDASWYVRPPSGGQFGPATGDVMRSWIGEGRVTADSLVWREGWEDWMTAESQFASLRTRPLIAATGPAWDPVQSAGPEHPNSGSSSHGRRSQQAQSRSSASAIFVTLLLITAVLLGILVFVLSR